MTCTLVLVTGLHPAKDVLEVLGDFHVVPLRRIFAIIFTISRLRTRESRFEYFGFFLIPSCTFVLEASLRWDQLVSNTTFLL